MYCLTNMCYVCLEHKDKSLININSSLSVNEDIIHIIGSLPCNLGWMKTRRVILICEECCLRLRQFYKFLVMCLKNSSLMQGYLDKVNTASTSSADNDAELLVDLNNKRGDSNERKCEIKLEDEEIYTFEREPIIDESEDVFVNVDDSFFKEEDTWKREEVDDKEESPVDNNFTENSDKKTDSEISLNNNTHDTGSDSSEVTRKQVHGTNKKVLTAAARKSYICSTCNKSFIKKNDLDNHTRVHTGEKPYQCAECRKCFSQKSCLAIHMSVHTGEKPFKCSRCEKFFARAFSLATHMRIHTGEKAFKCSRCEKCFGQNIDLVRHMRVHTGEKPFKCSTCEKCFSRLCNLKTHMRVHSGEKPFKCTRCEKYFSNSSNLVYHMRTHTGT